MVSCERAHSMTLPDAGQGVTGPEEWDELRVKEEPMFGSKGGDRGFWVPPRLQKVLYAAILFFD